MEKIKSFSKNINIENKRVILRADFNVPIIKGVIQDSTRIDLSIPFIKNLKTGTVSINDVMTHYGISSIPFGGEGVSGIGRLHGKEGLRSFSRTKSIVVNRFNFRVDVSIFPCISSIFV